MQAMLKPRWRHWKPCGVDNESNRKHGRHQELEPAQLQMATGNVLVKISTKAEALHLVDTDINGNLQQTEHNPENLEATNSAESTTDFKHEKMMVEIGGIFPKPNSRSGCKKLLESITTSMEESCAMNFNSAHVTANTKDKLNAADRSEASMNFSSTDVAAPKAGLSLESQNMVPEKPTLASSSAQISFNTAVCGQSQSKNDPSTCNGARPKSKPLRNSICSSSSYCSCSSKRQSRQNEYQEINGRSFPYRFHDRKTNSAAGFGWCNRISSPARDTWHSSSQKSLHLRDDAISYSQTQQWRASRFQNPVKRDYSLSPERVEQSSVNHQFQATACGGVNTTPSHHFRTKQRSSPKERWSQNRSWCRNNFQTEVRNTSLTHHRFKCHMSCQNREKRQCHKSENGYNLDQPRSHKAQRSEKITREENCKMYSRNHQVNRKYMSLKRSELIKRATHQSKQERSFSIQEKASREAISPSVKCQFGGTSVDLALTSSNSHSDDVSAVSVKSDLHSKESSQGVPSKMPERDQPSKKFQSNLNVDLDSEVRETRPNHNDKAISAGAKRIIEVTRLNHNDKAISAGANKFNNHTDNILNQSVNSSAITKNLPIIEPDRTKHEVMQKVFENTDQRDDSSLSSSRRNLELFSGLNNCSTIKALQESQLGLDSLKTLSNGLGVVGKRSDNELTNAALAPHMISQSSVMWVSNKCENKDQENQHEEDMHTDENVFSTEPNLEYLRTVHPGDNGEDVLNNLLSCDPSRITLASPQDLENKPEPKFNRDNHQSNPASQRKTFQDEIEEEMTRAKNLQIPVKLDTESSKQTNASLDPSASEFSPSLRDCHGNCFFMTNRKGTYYFVPKPEFMNHEPNVTVSSCPGREASTEVNEPITDVVVESSHRMNCEDNTDASKLCNITLYPCSHESISEDAQSNIKSSSKSVNMSCNRTPSENVSELHSHVTAFGNASETPQEGMNPGPVIPSFLGQVTSLFAHHLTQPDLNLTPPPVVSQFHAYPPQISPVFPQHPFMPVYVTPPNTALSVTQCPITEQHYPVMHSPGVPLICVPPVPNNMLVPHLPFPPFHGTSATVPYLMPPPTHSTLHQAPVFNLQAFCDATQNRTYIPASPFPPEFSGQRATCAMSTNHTNKNDSSHHAPVFSLQASSNVIKTFTSASSLPEVTGQRNTSTMSIDDPVLHRQPQTATDVKNATISCGTSSIDAVSGSPRRTEFAISVNNNDPASQGGASYEGELYPAPNTMDATKLADTHVVANVNDDINSLERGASNINSTFYTNRHAGSRITVGYYSREEYEECKKLVEKLINNVSPYAIQQIISLESKNGGQELERKFRIALEVVERGSYSLTVDEMVIIILNHVNR